MKSKNQHLNRTLNSLDEVHSLIIHSDNYNVRNIPRPKAVTGEKLKEYKRLENLRK